MGCDVTTLRHWLTILNPLLALATQETHVNYAQVSTTAKEFPEFLKFQALRNRERSYEMEVTLRNKQHGWMGEFLLPPFPSSFKKEARQHLLPPQLRWMFLRLLLLNSSPAYHHQPLLCCRKKWKNQFVELITIQRKSLVSEMWLERVSTKNTADSIN